MQAPVTKAQAAPISPRLQIRYGPNAAPRADRVTRSKMVFKAAADALLLGDLDECERLIELWHWLQKPEGGPST